MKKTILISSLILAGFASTVNALWKYNPFTHKLDYYSGASVSDKYIVCNVFTSTGINACIDALGLEGGEVFLPEGTYLGGAMPIVMDVSSITLTGSGRANTFLDWSSGQPAGTCINTNGKSHITIQNLSVIGNAGGGVTSNLIGDWDGAEYLTIRYCGLYNSDNYGMYLRGDNAKIIFNYVENCDNHGVKMRSYFLMFTHNLIIGCVSQLTGCYNSIITNNVSKDSSGEGFSINNCDYSMIALNTVNAPAQHGINITGNTRASTISNNAVMNVPNGYASIYINSLSDDNVVTNNTLRGNTATDKGIWIDNSDNNIIANNVTARHDAGIQEDNDCTGNFIYGNNCQDTIPYVINGTSPASFVSWSDIGIGTGTVTAQLHIVSNSSPSEYIVKVSSQDATVLFGIDGNGDITITEGSLTDSMIVDADIKPDDLNFTAFSDQLVLDDDTTFNSGSSSWTWRVNNPQSGAFDIDGSGAYAGDLLHVHQHTGNPGAGSILRCESEDMDIDPIVVIHQDAADIIADTVGLLISCVDDDDTNWIPLEIRDDSDSGNDVLFKVNYAGDVCISTCISSAQLNIVSNSAPEEYIVKVSSQDSAGLFTILGNGNVGIGTLSPNAKFQVAGAVLAAAGIFSGQLQSNSRNLVDIYDRLTTLTTPYALTIGQGYAISPIRSYAITVSSITGWASGGGSVVWMVEQRALLTVDSAGTDTLSGDVTSDNTWRGGTASDFTVSADYGLFLVITSVTGDVRDFKLKYRFTVD